MNGQGITIEEYPSLDSPVLIAGFDGWGNALNVSRGMVTYLIGKLKAQHFAKINPDVYYRYDDLRPIVDIDGGELKSLSPPGGSFYSVQNNGSFNDLIILEGDEPNLRWFQFMDELFSLGRKLGIQTLITLGSMYDNVLHTDRVISGIASTEALSAKLKAHSVSAVSYHGPSAIHSLINSEGEKRGFNCISLWCHCPYYLQGTSHFGLVSHLGSLLATLAEFELDVHELEKSWDKLNEQIEQLIQDNPELQTAISELRKAKVRGSWESMKASVRRNDNVINIRDFLDPK
jgi:proteasome assembly chaperone (PAC2) family protein